ncbi:MAG: MarR family winged helix-turn-helix transcriptional regulator [Aeromicrobium sp.]
MPTDSQKLAQSVVRLSRRLRQERQSDLTANQLSVLGTLRTKGPLTPSAIAAHERVQPPSMTRTIKCLDDAGLVTRGQNPDDGRQVIVTLSDKGEEVLAVERARRDQWLALRIAELGTAERKLLREAAVALDKLAAS